MTDDNQKHLSTDKRRREIAAAARAIILEKGFEGLRTREIAARVGINVATLHYHVPSKEALIELVGESVEQEFSEHNALLANSAQTPLEELQMLIADYKSIMVTRPDLLQFLEAMTNRARIDEKMAAIVGKMRRYWFGQFVTVLKQGKETGAFRSNLDPDSAAHIITGALVSFQYKPKHLLPLFDGVAAEIIRSIER